MFLQWYHKTEALHHLYDSNWSKPNNSIDIYTFAMSADKKKKKL